MKYFLLGITFGFSIISFSQNIPTDCSLFKTGQFIYEHSATKITWKIKRTKKIQTETNEATGAVTKSKIRWESACEYRLTQTWTNKKEFRKNNFKSKLYRIISINGSTYTFSCDCSDGTQISGAVVKVPG